MMANICIAPTEAHPWQFEAALYGEADAAFLDHIQRCTYCRNQLDGLRHEQQALHQLLYRADCPTLDELRAHAWKLSGPSRAAEIAVHLAICQLCTQEQAQLLGPLPATMAINSDDTGLLTNISRRIAVFVAQLLPHAPEAVPARRGPGQLNAPITQTYYIDEKDWEITLTISTDALGYVLSGQLLGPLPAALPGARLSGISSAGQVFQADIDATGWFELCIAAGDYALWLELESEIDHLRLVIDHVKLGA